MVAYGLLAATAAGICGLAEWMHAHRIARVKRLAYGPSGQAATWVRAVPALRCLAVAAAAWGLLFLLHYDPVAGEVDPKKEPSKQLLICLDVSPSMLVKDAGANSERVSRAAWAGRVVQTILDRLDMETTRITITAFYTDVLPVVQETFDKEVITNILDGLPMYVAFKPGPTDLHRGVTKSLELARRWPAQSATLLVISDGDADHTSIPMALPDSIADSIVIGVGDPHRSTLVSGHGSRQDSTSLKQLAARLGGTFHEGNRKHLPTAVLSSLSMVRPRRADSGGWREAALGAATTGCTLLALMSPALLLCGRRRAFANQRRAGAPRRRSEQLVPEHA